MKEDEVNVRHETVSSHSRRINLKKNVRPSLRWYMLQTTYPQTRSLQVERDNAREVCENCFTTLRRSSYDGVKDLKQRGLKGSELPAAHQIKRVTCRLFNVPRRLLRDDSTSTAGRVSAFEKYILVMYGWRMTSVPHLSVLTVHIPTPEKTRSAEGAGPSSSSSQK